MYDCYNDMKYISFVYFIILISLSGMTQESSYMKFSPLSVEEKYVIVEKGTEQPFTGNLLNNRKEGVYTCKKCDAPLYNSSDKFNSNCGWPSFDDEIEGAIEREIDADDRRTEILCNNCGAHLGHVFEGEQMTNKNTRHCVNSISLNFQAVLYNHLERAIFAGGCFWGVEYYLQKQNGVISTTVGYTGGHIENPSYEEVCSHASGHIEAIEVIFDASKTDYETLTKIFFEIHDPTQIDRQGPDRGEQYRSEIFYMNDSQKTIAERLIIILEKKGLNVATKLSPAGKFWVAEKYHQDYYQRGGETPYCHAYEKRF